MVLRRGQSWPATHPISASAPPCLVRLTGWGDRRSVETPECPTRSSQVARQRRIVKLYAWVPNHERINATVPARRLFGHSPTHRTEHRSDPSLGEDSRRRSIRVYRLDGLPLPVADPLTLSWWPVAQPTGRLKVPSALMAARRYSTCSGGFEASMPDLMKYVNHELRGNATTGP